jgi:hypothetical protein
MIERKIDSAPESFWWGSVRKVRFASQLMRLIKYAVENDGRIFSENDIESIIEEDRANREAIRLKITQTGWRRALRHFRAQVSYKSLVKDTIAFAKGVGIFSLREERIFCSPQTKELYSRQRVSQTEYEKGIITLLLNSKYKAYRLFLTHLQDNKGHFYIPLNYRSRSKSSGLRSFLKSNGFLTDVASFYTIRDLLYDLGLINWRINSESDSEHIFLTCKIVSSDAVELIYENKVRLEDESMLIYNKRLQSLEFEDTVSRNYLSLSQQQWGVIVDLLELRERVTEEICISDHQFNKLIVGLEAGTTVTAELSQGTISFKPSSGLLIKALNCPVIGDEIYATYIRLYRRN